MAWHKLDATGLTPAPRGGSAVASVGSTLLVFGGADRTPCAYDDLWQMEIGSCCEAQWTRISAAFPASVACTARSGAALVPVGDKVYLFGGQEPNTGLCFSDILQLDTHTWTWTHLQVEGPRPPARHSCVAVSFKDQCLVVYGGAGHQGALTDVWVFNCADHTWSSPRIRGQPPAAREMAAGALLSSDRLLIHGGRSTDKIVLDDAVELSMGSEWSWDNSSSTGLRRCAHTLVALQEFEKQQQQQQSSGGVAAPDAGQPDNQQQQQQQRLIVFGGFSGEAVEGSLWVLLQQQQQQQQQHALTTETCSSWSAKQLHAGVGLQAGMAAEQGGRGSNSSTQGSSKQLCPAPRFAHAAVCLPDRCNATQQVMVVIGGINPVEDLMDCYMWRHSPS